jgi:hypothetical protein
MFLSCLDSITIGCVDGRRTGIGGRGAIGVIKPPYSPNDIGVRVCRRGARHSSRIGVVLGWSRDKLLVASVRLATDTRWKVTFALFP